MKRYIRASFNDSSIPDWLRKDKIALSYLNKKGVDLKNCTFSRERKGRVGDNYTVYLINGSKEKDAYRPFVWIPGIYNDDECVSIRNWNKRGYDPESGTYKYGALNTQYIKYVPKKDLNIADVVYINIADNKKAPRDHYEDPRYDNGNYAGQAMIPEGRRWSSETHQYEDEPAHWSKQGTETSWGGIRENNFRDKSGYWIPDPKARLEKFHNSPEGKTRQGEKAKKQLEDVYSQLISLKADILNTLNAAPMESFGDGHYALQNFSSAIGYYNRALKKLNPDDWGYDPNDALQDARYAQRSINDTKRFLEGKGNM